MTEKNVSRPAYARLRNLSTQAVDLAVKSGRIAGAVDENGKLNIALADELWAKNTHPGRGENAHSANRKKPRPADADEKILVAAAKIGLTADEIPSLMESKTLEAAYKAKLAKIEYEEKSKILVEAEAVKKEAFRVARITRDAMLAIPDRLAAELAGMTEPFVIHAKMMAEIRTAIAEVVKGIGE